MTVPMVGHQVQSWLGKFCLQYIYICADKGEAWEVGKQSEPLDQAAVSEGCGQTEAGSYIFAKGYINLAN